jgi:hypothetical protein
MSNGRRLRISLKREGALSASRMSVENDKLVYVLVCDKKIKYPKKKSRVVYIGATKKGISRIARSVAYRAQNILEIHGVRKFQVRILTCKPRQKIKTWHKLERALLIEFKETYGDIPQCNSQGHRIKKTDEDKYFRSKRLHNILEELE